MQRNPLTHEAKEALFVPVQHALIPQTILTEEATCLLSRTHALITAVYWLLAGLWYKAGS